jgi:hypothetical protein
MNRMTAAAGAALGLVALSALAAKAQRAAEPARPVVPAAQTATPAKPAPSVTAPVAGKEAREASALPQVRKHTQPRNPKSAVAAEDVLYLTRATLLALNDANATGNYAVLRELGSAGFRARHSADQLARIFGPFRLARFNMGAVALITPQLTIAPRLDAQGHLRFAGHFPTEPMAIRFELAFAREEDRWRIADLGVSTVRHASLAHPAAAAPAPAAR